MGRPKNPKAGKHQVNVRLSDKQQRILMDFIYIKRFRSAGDAVRYMIEGAEDFTVREMAKLKAETSAAKPAAAKTPEPQISPPEPKPARTPVSLPRVADAESGLGEELDEDGNPLSLAAQMIKNRAKPAMMSEDGRYPSLAGEP